MKTQDYSQLEAHRAEAASRGAAPVSIEELAALDFFRGLSKRHLEELRSHTKVSFFEPGEVLLRQGELANRFYVIVSGRVAIEHEVGGDVLRVQEIGPGEPAGFSWSFTPENLHFTARAIGPVKAIFFYGTLLQEDCDLDPTLGYEMMTRAGRILIQRMESLIQILKRDRSLRAEGRSAPAAG